MYYSTWWNTMMRGKKIRKNKTKKMINVFFVVNIVTIFNFDLAFIPDLCLKVPSTTSLHLRKGSVRFLSLPAFL